MARPAPRSGILGPLLGGALAALGGFGLSHFNVFGLAAPDQLAEVTALAQRLETAVAAIEAGQAGLDNALRQEISVLADRVTAAEAAPGVDLSGLADLDARLQAIEALPPGGDASTTALAAQLADLQRRLDAMPTAGANTAEVDAALARLAEVEAEAQARADAAAAAAEAATQARAREVLAAAAATSATFDAELAAVADPDLQAQLAPFAAGVASLADLQATFPDAARSALQVARATDAEAGWGTRLIDFLGAQTGARSLEPREGDTPDAILSRAEFALGEARLADALAELDTLSPEVQAPLADWRAKAEARLAVDAALAGGL
ncbi:MAG: hypothetical protein EAZ40_15140 [Rhodobacterales bacterium]|nr:MAG: hypothetical protein EAZ40_15140 [Rhodobacterales bacterium]